MSVAEVRLCLMQHPVGVRVVLGPMPMSRAWVGGLPRIHGRTAEESPNRDVTVRWLSQTQQAL